MRADRKYPAFFSLLTKYTLITGLLFHFSAIDFNPNISDNNIEVVDDTNEGDEKDTEEKELFFSGHFSDFHTNSNNLEFILHQHEMKPTLHFSEIPSPPPDQFS